MEEQKPLDFNIPSLVEGLIPKPQAPPKVPSMLETVGMVESTLKAHFEIKDWEGIRIILAISAAHYIPGEPLWVRIVGGSRSGRTELLRALIKDEDSTEMEALTPASIRGGLRGGAKVLDRVNEKRVITKDLVPLITTRKDIRLEIFGLLRSVKDGSLSSDFGTAEGHIQQEGTFDWILAVTPLIESIRQVESLLGERFIDLQWIAGNREEMAYRAAQNNPHLKSIREELSASVCSLLSRAKKVAKDKMPTLNEDEIRLIAKWADSTTLCRSPVDKDRFGHIQSMPKPESPTSMAQDFQRIALGLKLIGIEEWQPYLQRLAWDCIPSVRATILRSLIASHTEKEIQSITGLSQTTINYHLNDLRLLKIIRKEGDKAVLQVKLP